MWHGGGEPRSLNNDRSLLVMARLPDSDRRPVGLNLIDVLPRDPDVLILNDRLLHDYRLRHNRLRHNRLRHNRRRLLNDNRIAIRICQGIIDDSADDPADESRPEVATATSPPPAMTIRPVMPAVMIAAVPAVMTAVPGKSAKGHGHHRHC